MVAVVAQNTRLNTKFDQSKSAYAVKISSPGFPISPTMSSPKRRPKPIRIKTTHPIQKSIRFFMRILPAFFALANPDSTIANPACIQKTRAAPMRNHTANSFPSISSNTSSINLSSISIFYKNKGRPGYKTETPLPQQNVS